MEIGAAQIDISFDITLSQQNPGTEQIG